MEVSVREIEEGLDPHYDVQDIGQDGYKVINEETGEEGKVSFGIDDGNAFMEVNSWTGTDDTVYETDAHTDSFMDASVLDEVLTDEEVEDIGNRARSVLSNGMKQAYEQSDKEEQARTLLNSAHRAYGLLESEGKAVGSFSLESKLEEPLGNAVVHYGESPDDENESVDRGVEYFKLDMEDYEQDREFATPATYIMGAILLNESECNMKPEVKTGMAYKTGSQHHDTQEEKADTELVETASEISQYDFLN
jgi:hypothetical protein